MDVNRARALLDAERAEVQDLLKGAEEAEERDYEAEADDVPGDYADSALPLTAETEDAAVEESLRTRLAAIDRALARLDDGTYGRSIISGQPIPGERLEADPAAELTIEEARAAEKAQG
jgi:RNA polymerase-binding transcription factor